MSAPGRTPKQVLEPRPALERRLAAEPKPGSKSASSKNVQSHERYAACLGGLRARRSHSKPVFSELSKGASVTEVAIRLVVAVVVGGIIGWDRERLNKPAGIRTHMLVSLGSATFTL